MNVHYTGLEYNDIVFVDSVSQLNKNAAFSDVRVDTDEVSDLEDESKFNLAFPMQYQSSFDKSKATELNNATN